MVSSPAPSVDAYVASLPADRREAIATVRKTILRKLPRGYEEGMMGGMIAYFVPKSRLAETYNGQPLMLAALASQKQHMSLYLLAVYGHEELRAWFEQAWRAAGKKLDMGKSCVRFKQLDDLSLDIVGETIARVSVDRYVEHYHAVRADTAEGRRAAAKAASKAAKTSTSAKTPTATKTSASAKTSTAKKTSAAKPKTATKAVTKPAAKSSSRAKPAAKTAGRAARSAAGKRSRGA